MAQRIDSVLVADLPRILHPHRFGILFQGDYIKTQVAELALTLLYPPQHCTACDTALFVNRNAFKRAAVTVVVAQTNLHNDCGIALGHDEVNFPTAAAMVLCHQNEPLRFKQF